MLFENSTDGWYRRLWRGDEGALLAHYRRLSPEDRRLRFLHAVSDAFLVGHAQKLRNAAYHAIGWFRGGVLRGVVEIALEGAEGEMSFSVEAPWRNLGIGRGLMRRALRRARQAGCRRLAVLSLPENAAMIRLTRRFGAQLSHRDGEIIGTLVPSRANWAEIGAGLVDDRISLLAANWEALWSLFAAPPWFGLGLAERHCDGSA